MQTTLLKTESSKSSKPREKRTSRLSGTTPTVSRRKNSQLPRRDASRLRKSLKSSAFVSCRSALLIVKVRLTHSVPREHLRTESVKLAEKRKRRLSWREGRQSSLIRSVASSSSRRKS